jgi:hypothetical protein
MGSLTAVSAVVFTLVVVSPLAAAGSVPEVSALGGPAAIVTVPDSRVEPRIDPTTTTSVTLPDTPPPTSDEELLALAERPSPGVSAVAPVVSAPSATSPDEPTVLAAPAAPTPASGQLDPALQLVEGVPQAAVASDRALVVAPIPDDPFGCHERAASLPLLDAGGTYDRNLVAQLTHTLFECVASVHGYADVEATSTSAWDGAGIWGFASMAELVAAESVVVGYCESQAFAPFAISGDNPWGYGGVFQMGDREMRLFGFDGASKFEPVDNVYSAAIYFMSGVERGFAWGGWGPWAVVNTGYNDEVNDKVKIPVLPRFVSTDPEFRGRRGVELPAWAVDPWRYEVPDFDGCPFTGRAWPDAVPLEPAA